MRVLTQLFFFLIILFASCKQNNDQKILVEEFKQSGTPSRSESTEEKEQTQKREREVYFNPEIIDIFPIWFT